MAFSTLFVFIVAFCFFYFFIIPFIERSFGENKDDLEKIILELKNKQLILEKSKKEISIISNSMEVEKELQSVTKKLSKEEEKLRKIIAKGLS